MAALQGQLISHLARRGMEQVSELPKMSMEMDRDDLMQVQQGQWNDIFNQLPAWGIVMVGVIIFLLYVLMLSVRLPAAELRQMRYTRCTSAQLFKPHQEANLGV